MAKILIVDDSHTARLLLKAILQKLGHEIIGEATNGLEGYDMYFQLKPDIVTMDITMPVLNGIACIEKIKENDKDANILLITSNAQAQMLSEAVSAGISGYIFKPILEEELKNTINRILKTDNQ